MYTILVKDDFTLVATNRENIFHRSSMAHKLRFLVDPIYTKNGKEIDLRTCICTLEYRTPISHKYTPLILSPSADLYKEKVEYLIPVDTNITAEVGNVEMFLGWKKLTMNPDGSFEPFVEYTGKTEIEILPVERWSDYIADENLDYLAQFLLKNEAQNQQMQTYVDQIYQMSQSIMLDKADNIRTEDVDGKQYVQLESMGMPIGDAVEVKAGECDLSEGVPVVEFTSVEPEGDKEVDNVVEF